MRQVFLLLAPIAVAVATPLAAQTSALKGLDTSGPIDVDAARIEVRDADNQAVFSGAVVIRQGKLTLNADTVRVLYSRDAANNLAMQRLDARGNVRLVSPSERATSNTAVYDVNGKLITMSGNVNLDRNGSMLKGQRLVLNLTSGQTIFNGGATATTPGAPGRVSGRVSGRFIVPDRGKK